MPNTTIKTEPALLADLDVDMEGSTTNNGERTATAAGGGDAGHGEPEARIPLPPPPAKKDRNLREFLGMMDDYAPIIPDAVTDYYLSLSGLSTSDPRLKRLLALAAQKFIADIAADAYQYSRVRQNSSSTGGVPSGGAVGGGTGAAGSSAPGGNFRPVARPGFGGGGGSGGSAGRTVLTMEDLGSAVGEYGVNTRRPEFYR